MSERTAGNFAVADSSLPIPELLLDGTFGLR